MCGIVGEFAVTGSVPLESWRRIEVLSDLMRRRGPDDAGVWSDHRHCTLGFRRLSILDLTAAGHQPMESQDGRHVLVFNGELYNFRELRRRLQPLGYSFRSTGDTEVVLASLAEWGAQALAQFNGMFALAFYDSDERRLLLARDHAGIKPLYYLDVGDKLLFASQYDQILRHPWSRPLSISPEAMGEYLRYGYIRAPGAALERTHMLEPGTWLSIDASGRVARGAYYRFPASPEPSLRGDAANEAVDAAVTAAVRRQLVSDVAVGAFLSGGIDSPLVVAKAQSALSKPLPAYTMGTNGDRFDESTQAADYARELGVDHRLEQVSAGTVLELIDDVVASVTEPFADHSIFPTLLVSRMASRDVKVVLSGDGGDELFWGYAGRFASVLRKASKFAQPYWFRTVQRAVRRLTGVGRGESHLAMRSIGDWYRAKHSRIPDHWLERLFPDTPPTSMSARLFDFDGHRDSPTANWLRWNEFIGHLTMVLLKVDRASMFHSIEVRVPLLDREVIDVATAVDWSSCLDLESGLGKLPLRASLARHTNRQTLEKRGFQVPMGEWMRTSLRPVFEDTVLSRSELAGAPIARASLRQMYDVHLSGAQDLASGLWVLLSLAMWEDHHLLARGRSERGPERPSLTVSARTPTTGREPGPVPESLSGGRGR